MLLQRPLYVQIVIFQEIISTQPRELLKIVYYVLFVYDNRDNVKFWLNTFYYISQ